MLETSEREEETEALNSQIFWERFWTRLELVLLENFSSLPYAGPETNIYRFRFVNPKFLNTFWWPSVPLYKWFLLYMCLYLLLAFMSCLLSWIPKHSCSHENSLHISSLQSSIAKRMYQSVSCSLHACKECVSKHDTFTLAVVFWTNIKIAFNLKGRYCRIPRSWSAIQYYMDLNSWKTHL